MKMVVMVSMWVLLREERVYSEYYESRTWTLVCKIMKDLHLSCIPFPNNDLI